ncbi:TPA: thioredoxin TrxC [Legionella pneumophila]|uniref:thioredoxin TrxC n=1 Tax=Legionella TaxID=445 RepID=UPI000F0017FB|nr:MULTISPECIES: thioredoxin TrxC [Legionella]MCK1847891.1 thioredoxin TrxC [Legionella pneumophila]RMX17729.1 thioredoxin TrxC [Legionella jordanis]HAT1880064.1 thioredoxin TrxC [Legionella pneumophila]HAU0182670.1 thioredoxin TrxC [Legionella pneumophila]HAU0785983.1 thioredoxin TrxC [Legionella pneumophila]
MSDSIHIVCPHCHTTNRLFSSRLAEHPKCGKCQKSLFEGNPVALNAAQFDLHLKKNDIPLLVDFWAPWCGPCKMMAPYFEAAATLLEPEVRLVKINTESEQALAARYQIQSIPTLMLFSHGKEHARYSGVMSAQDIVRWVKQNF